LNCIRFRASPADHPWPLMADSPTIGNRVGGSSLGQGRGELGIWQPGKLAARGAPAPRSPSRLPATPPEWPGARRSGARQSGPYGAGSAGRRGREDKGVHVDTAHKAGRIEKAELELLVAEDLIRYLLPDVARFVESRNPPQPDVVVNLQDGRSIGIEVCSLNRRAAVGGKRASAPISRRAKRGDRLATVAARLCPPRHAGRSRDCNSSVCAGLRELSTSAQLPRWTLRAPLCSRGWSLHGRTKSVVQSPPCAWALSAID